MRRKEKGRTTAQRADRQRFQVPETLRERLGAGADVLAGSRDLARRRQAQTLRAAA